MLTIFSPLHELLIIYLKPNRCPSGQGHGPFYFISASKWMRLETGFFLESKSKFRIKLAVCNERRVTDMRYHEDVQLRFNLIKQFAYL